MDSNQRWFAPSAVGRARTRCRGSPHRLQRAIWHLAHKGLLPANGLAVLHPLGQRSGALGVAGRRALYSRSRCRARLRRLTLPSSDGDMVPNQDVPCSHVYQDRLALARQAVHEDILSYHPLDVGDPASGQHAAARPRKAADGAP
jgi:hypothetical protein